MEPSASNLSFDLKWWQRIQDLFAEIIGANVTFFTSLGTHLSTPSQVAPSCLDLAQPTGTTFSGEFDCVAQAFQNVVRDKQHSFSCSHGLHFFATDFQPDEHKVGGVVVGPLLIGKREEESVYRELCEKLAIDPDVFCDRIREIKVFSFHGIQVVLDFLREMTEYALRLSEQQKQLETLIPGFQEEFKNPAQFLSIVQLNRVAHYLLEIALWMLKGDSGSVLLLNSDSESFSVKTGRGLNPEILKQSKIPVRETVAGWVIENKRSVLIDRDYQNELLRNRLKRPEIVSSILVPITCSEKPLGILCVNATSENPRFNSENLAVLDQLGKLAGIASISTLEPPQ